MNNGPIERLLRDMEPDLRQTIGDDDSARTLEELRSHLRERTDEYVAQGLPLDIAEAEAVACFGDRKELTRDLVSVQDEHRLNSHAIRTLVFAGLAVGIPVFSDLAMDLSSWLTGSDSRLYAGAFIPAAFAIGVIFTSIRARKVLVLPLAGIVLSCYLLSTIIGGFAQARSANPLGSTQVRGTAFRRLQGIETESLPQYRFETQRATAVMKLLETGSSRQELASLLTADPNNQMPILRSGNYFVAPAEPTYWNRSINGEEFRVLHPEQLPSLALAEKRWREHGNLYHASMQAFATEAEREIQDLKRVVSSPWSSTVLYLMPYKTGLACLAFLLLLLFNAFGVAVGAVGERIRPTTK